MLNLADYGRIRVMADQLGIESIDREGRVVVVKFGPKTKADPVRLVSLARSRADVTIMPPSGLKLALDGASARSGPGATQSRPVPPAASQKPREQRPGRSPQKARRTDVAPSWWVARATEGEVRPGFTKAEILKTAADDPRAPGGVFERVGGLLSEILDQ